MKETLVQKALDEIDGLAKEFGQLMLEKMAIESAPSLDISDEVETQWGERLTEIGNRMDEIRAEIRAIKTSFKITQKRELLN